MKRISALFSSVLMLCMAFSGCGGGSKQTTTTTGNSSSTTTLVSINITSAGSATSIPVGATLQLTAMGKYSDGSTADLTSQVTWGLSDSSMASVSSAGLLTGTKMGTLTATASKGTVSGTLVLSVTKAAVNSIAVSGGASLAAGFTEQLAAQGTFTDNSTQSITTQATWQSSDATIATVNTLGVLTALKPGSVVITASIGKVSGTLSVAVNAPTLASITVDGYSLASGTTEQLSALGTYSDNSTQSLNSQVTWQSSDNTIASVSSTGLLTALKQGSVTVTASLGAMSGSALIVVNAPTLSTLTLSPASFSIASGQNQALTAQGVYSDGTTHDVTSQVTWNSSNSGVASVSAAGLAIGVSAGASTITATSSGVSGTAALTVTSAVLTSIDISPDDQTIPIGGQIQLTLTGSYSDNTTQNLTGATWSSSDSTLASVDPVTGVVTGVANSNNNPVTITATYGGFTNTTTVTVTSAVPESLTITPTTGSIAAGTTQQYSVNQIYSDGSIQPIVSGLSWISSSATTASVDTNGLATGISPGQTTITVAYGSMTASASLTVTSAALTALVVTPVTTTVGINGNVQYTATGVFSDNSTEDLTSQAVWSSSVANFALISNTGLATGLSAGTTTISATYGGVSGSATLNVTTATLVSINITPANPIVPPHSRIQLTAIGVFSDGTQVKLSGVSWRTNSARYAMVSSTGVVRTKKASNQPAVVSASLNGIIGQTNLTISNMTITSVQLTPATPTIAVGTTQQFALIGTFSDGVTTVDLTPSARWQTSNYQDAVINRSGIASGLAAGTVTITGTYKGQSPATATLTVSNATIQSISVTPASPTVPLGGLQQFAASGLFSDGSTQDITAVSQWTSATPTVAVVNATGLASSASHGQTNINATFKGVTGSTTLNVN